MAKLSRKSAERIWKVKVKEGGKCELCLRDNLQLHAHHIERKQSTFLLLELSNGICLCAYHHMNLHGINGYTALDETKDLLEKHLGKAHLQQLKQWKNNPPKVSLEEMVELLKSH